MRKVRLLAVIADLGGGGAERQFALLMRQLSRERFETEICLWRDVARNRVPPDLPLHHVRKTRPWHVFGAIWGTRRLIDELEPDLIYSQLHYTNMVVGTALSLPGHRPRWVCRQVNDPRHEMRHLFAIWARWALRQVDRVIGCSEGVRKEVVEYLGVPEERTINLDNLADVEAILEGSRQALPTTLSRRDDVFVVAHAGRFAWQKNHRVLLEAFAHLPEPAELWLLGEGPLEANLKALAERLGIGARVRWLGYQENPHRFLAAADCVALTSHYEGLPNVVIESMLCGTPVVAAQCPFGPDELIDHGRTGLLVPPNDSEAVAAALEKLRADPELRRRLGEAARSDTLARFDLERVGKTYERLFVEVGGSSGSHRQEGAAPAP